jgi:hypothetical protein
MLLPVTWIVAKSSVSALGQAVRLDAIMTRWCRLPHSRFPGGAKLRRFAPQSRFDTLSVRLPPPQTSHSPQPT